jgi:phosphate transport system substrate-binding protein
MNYKKILVSAIAVAIITMMFATTVLASTPVSPNNLITPGSNTLTLRGSSTVYPISNFIKTYWQTQTGATLNLPTAEGSGKGLDYLASGTTDMAMSSKIPDYKSSISNPTKDRNYWSSTIDTTYGMDDLRIWAVGKDSLAIVVSAANPWYSTIQKVCNASMISDLFCNKADGTPYYPTWGSFLTAIGHPDPAADSIPIVCYTRVLDSGTHDCFKSLILPQGEKIGGATRSDSNLRAHGTLDTNQEVLTTVGADEHAIAYIALGICEANPSSIKGLWIGTGNPASNFVEPKRVNVYNGSYKYDGVSQATPAVIYRWLWYATNGIPTATSEGAIKSTFVSYARASRAALDANDYLWIYRADLTGSAATPFASMDTGAKHPSLPDNDVNSDDIAYFVNGYIAYYANGGLNPYCDYDGNKEVNSDDIASFVNYYIKFYAGTDIPIPA